VALLELRGAGAMPCPGWVELSGPLAGLAACANVLPSEPGTVALLELREAGAAPCHGWVELPG